MLTAQALIDYLKQPFVYVWVIAWPDPDVQIVVKAVKHKVIQQLKLLDPDTPLHDTRICEDGDVILG